MSSLSSTQQTCQWDLSNQELSQQEISQQELDINPVHYSSTEPNMIVGIQLGASYVSVGVYRNHSVEIFPNDRGNRAKPNVMSFTVDGILFGEAAQDMLVSGENPTGTVFDIDRLIGKEFDDPTVQDATKDLPFKIVNVAGEPHVEVKVMKEPKRFSPKEITSMVLARMKHLADKFVKGGVKQAIVSVPVDFNEIQRDATIRAGKLVGLEIIGPIREPTAAALAYGIHATNERLASFHGYNGPQNFRSVVVYNLGIRSFSISLLSFDDGVLDIEATAGHNEVGEQALQEGRVKETEIDDIIVIGGSENVHSSLESYFGKTAHNGIDDDEVVAHGVVLQVGIFMNAYRAREFRYPVYPLNLGIETTGGLMWPLIKRGDPFPAFGEAIFTTAEDYQTTVLIRVYEGLSLYTNNSHLHGEFEVFARNMGNREEVEFRDNGSCSISYEELELMAEEAERHKEDEERVEKRNEIASYAFNNRTMNTLDGGSIRLGDSCNATMTKGMENF
ncbi:HSP70-domain-containing protein [Melanomma pulvis-pyrius CBS 109.77]|uniref:HSP70-domain-containing protein n=1 Tax=Melanomma pulvis-pyrius CBS 109.77 TaxID=1314802 RepID=A0A6A6XVB2_9PLEO|nr:HSP70-domain-containing protein [Melanomma pulvis-pyrius CBS 109.77]